MKKAFFEEEGLYVTIEAQANWKVLLDGVIDGRLDGAHMLAGQPIAATMGYGTKANIITPFSMDLNGNGITVSNKIWEQMKVNIPKQADGKPVHPIKADALKPVIDKYNAEGKPFNMGMVFPVSTHNYELRYWLAAGGIHPGFLCASQRRYLRQDRRRCLPICHATITNACHSGSRNNIRLLRGRTLEPTSRVQEYWRARGDRL